MKPLEGIRVLDLTQAYSGPFCTMQLADFGAEVIKIEQPEIGDITRAWLPVVDGKSPYFTCINRGKKSITLDLRTEKGQEVFLKLAETADIVVDNYRGGIREKYNIDYEKLKKINPKIISASLSGYGNWGPMKKIGAFAQMAEAYGGLMNLTGFTDQSPVKSGNSAGDLYAGIMLVYGICMALYHREKTGEGQNIDISMMDAVFQTLEAGIINTGLTGKSPQRMGNRHPSGGPYNCFKAKDGWCVIGTPVWAQWHSLCRVIGKEEWIDDPKFANHKCNKQNEDEIDAQINEWVKDKTRQEIEEIMAENKITFAQVLDIKEVMEHPQTKAREMVVEVDDPSFGKIKMQGVPVKMSLTPGSVDASAPGLGQHSEEIFAGIGLSEKDIRELKENKVV